MAHRYELYKHARFHTAVEHSAWDDDAMRWRTRVRVGGGKEAEFGSEYMIESDYLVSAVGQLNVPYRPDIPGIDQYEGRLMHSARWDWSFPIEGKRVAIIGTGVFLLGPLERLEHVLRTKQEQQRRRLFQRSPLLRNISQSFKGHQPGLSTAMTVGSHCGKEHCSDTVLHSAGVIVPLAWTCGSCSSKP